MDGKAEDHALRVSWKRSFFSHFMVTFRAQTARHHCPFQDMITLLGVVVFFFCAFSVQVRLPAASVLGSMGGSATKTMPKPTGAHFTGLFRLKQSEAIQRMPFSDISDTQIQTWFPVLQRGPPLERPCGPSRHWGLSFGPSPFRWTGRGLWWRSL